jgi:hypothetical protein
VPTTSADAAGVPQPIGPRLVVTVTVPDSPAARGLAASVMLTVFPVAVPN